MCFLNTAEGVVERGQRCGGDREAVVIKRSLRARRGLQLGPSRLCGQQLPLEDPGTQEREQRGRSRVQEKVGGPARKREGS